MGAGLSREEAEAELDIVSKLVLHVPGGAMRDIPLDRDRLTLGRRADNDVCLPYPAVSAEHAAIVTVLEDSFLEDLQSTNGTLVNGNRIIKHFLRDHDVIDVGRVQLVYLVDNEETVAALPADDPPAQIHAASETETSERDGSLVDTGESAIDDGECQESASESLAPADDLLEDLMDMDPGSSVAVDMPPTMSVVPSARRSLRRERLRRDTTTGVFVEVMNGPNAGQIAAMTKREFLLGKAGATKAVIRRDNDRFSLVPVDSSESSFVNGERVAPEGRELAFGDTIDVAAVRLRFGRRPPL